jgi:hypothetical protein
MLIGLCKLDLSFGCYFIYANHFGIAMLFMERNLSNTAEGKNKRQEAGLCKTATSRSRRHGNSAKKVLVSNIWQLCFNLGPIVTTSYSKVTSSESGAIAQHEEKFSFMQGFSM